MAGNRTVWKSLVVLLLLCLVHIAKLQQLQFGGNVGTDLYQFQYQERNDTSGLDSPLPPGQFQVQCLLNGMESNDISYWLIDDGDGTFRMDVNTGVLALQGGQYLDYETRITYFMSAACNITSNPNISRGVAQINFNVLPVNEFKPVLRIVSNPITRVAIVDEFSEIGQVIALREEGTNVVVPSSAYGYIIDDRDQGEPVMLNLFPSSSLDDSLYNLQQSGTITLAKKLDLDDGTRQGIDFVDIRVCNSLPPTGISCGNLNFNVFLRRSNDHDPIFSQNVYSVTIAENLPPSSFVMNVSCTDGDYDVGAFEDVTSSSPFFNVSIISGQTYQQVFLISMLDYEQASAHSVTLTCTDNRGKNTTATLAVTVVPINDNQPRFSQRSYIFQVSRFLTLGSEIGRIQATDNDQDEGNTLTYMLTNTTNFQIEPDGTIILRDFVYVIEGQTFQLLAVASDGQFNTTAQVLITMTGVVSIPEVILICMGTVIFIVLIIFIIVCCCYIRVAFLGVLPKHPRSASQEMLAEDAANAVVLEPLSMFPMQPMESMYQQGKGHAYMLGKVPTETEDHLERSFGHNSSTDFDDPDQGSIRTASSRMYTPTSNLVQMIEKFKEGDKILDKKSKKSVL